MARNLLLPMQNRVLLARQTDGIGGVLVGGGGGWWGRAPPPHNKKHPITLAR